MNLLLDTTYFLPAVGILIENIPQLATLNLIGKGHRIFICYITIFELSAKSGKYVVAGKIPSERTLGGIRFIIYDERVEKFSKSSREYKPSFQDSIDQTNIVAIHKLPCDAYITDP